MDILQIKKLAIDDFVKVYEERLVIDFPPEELKPIRVITSLMKRGLYLCYGLFDEGEMVAYAFFACMEGYRDILIDYLAVSAVSRGKGYGSQFLALMKEELKDYDSIIFEVESGKSAKTYEEVELCQKRLAFYRKNGLIDTALNLSLFGIDMKLLYLPLKKEPSDEEMKEVLDLIYDEFYGVELHKENVIISLY